MFRRNLSAVLATGNAAGNRKITGLATPTLGTDAAHKTYVDNEAAKKVSKAGDTMTGNLSVPAPNANPHAATKEYVDTVVASAAGGGTYQISCSNHSYGSSISIGFCIRLNTSTGATECKYRSRGLNDSAVGAGWYNCSAQSGICSYSLVIGKAA